MRMIDDDEVGLKEKPEDTRNIKRLYQNETWSTGSVGKQNIMDLIPNVMPLLGTTDPGMGRIVTPCQAVEGDEIHTQRFPLHRTVSCIETAVQGLVTPFYWHAAISVLTHCKWWFPLSRAIHLKSKIQCSLTPKWHLFSIQPQLSHYFYFNSDL